MKSYYQAITVAACSLGNMPDPNSSPGLFIVWAEDICELISEIYGRGFDEVCNDLRDRLVDNGVIEVDED